MIFYLNVQVNNDDV